MLFIFTELLMFGSQIITKKTKVIGLFGLLVFGYLAGSVSSTISDYGMYEGFYYSASYGTRYFERGYTEFALFFLKNGYNYQQFRLIFSIIIAIILYIGVSMFTNNVALFTGIYGITIFFLDVIQIRNMAMIALVVLGIAFLKKRNLVNVILSMFIIFISAQFQSIGYIFLIVPPAYYLMKNYKNKKALIIVVPIMLFAIFEIIGVSQLSQILSRVAGFASSRDNLSEKINSQYIYGSPFFKTVFIYLTTILAFILNNSILNRHNEDNDELKNINLIMNGAMIALPLVMVAIDYSRIQRNAFVFLLVGIAIDSSRRKNFNIVDLEYLTVVIFIIAMNLITWGGPFWRSIPVIIKL